MCWVAAEPPCYKSNSHLGNLPHVLNGGPFIWELGKYFLNFGNETVDVDVGLGPALREVELWNAFTQRCGDGPLSPHLCLRTNMGRNKLLATDASKYLIPLGFNFLACGKARLCNIHVASVHITQ